MEVTEQPLSVSHALWAWQCPLDPVLWLEGSRVTLILHWDVTIQPTFLSNSTESNDGVSVLPESAQEMSALAGVWAGLPQTTLPHVCLSLQTFREQATPKWSTSHSALL